MASSKIFTAYTFLLKFFIKIQIATAFICYSAQTYNKVQQICYIIKLNLKQDAISDRTNHSTGMNM